MIKTLIFDMGNVLINFNYKIAGHNVSLLCKTQPERIREFLFDSGLQLAYEAGKYTGVEIYHLIKDHFKEDFSLEDLRQAACSMFWPKPEMEEIALNLRSQGYRMLLLSNICDIHFDFIKEKYSFPQYFDECILSFQVGCCKPDPAIYLKTLSLARTPADQCFFIDDLEENVIAAQNLGIKGHHFQNVAGLKLALSAYGIEC